MNRRTSIVAVITAASIAAAGGLVYASQTGMNDATTALAKANISLEQAIAAAQQHQGGGKATKAELESEKGATFYEVEVVSNNQVFDIKIDAINGTVLSSKLDKQDSEESDDD